MVGLKEDEMAVMWVAETVVWKVALTVVWRAAT